MALRSRVLHARNDNDDECSIVFTLRKRSSARDEASTVPGVSCARLTVNRSSGITLSTCKSPNLQTHTHNLCYCCSAMKDAKEGKGSPTLHVSTETHADPSL